MKLKILGNWELSVDEVNEKWFLDWVLGFSWLQTVASPLLSLGDAMAQVVDRLGEWVALGFRQLVLFTHDRASDQTLELLAEQVIPAL